MNTVDQAIAICELELQKWDAIMDALKGSPMYAVPLASAIEVVYNQEIVRMKVYFATGKTEERPAEIFEETLAMVRKTFGPQSL
jgi:hypothetical protein